jgi:hypothetical protein
MTERIDICNLALGWIGADTITGLEDETVEARQCLNNYALARDATLEAHDWSFAMKRFTPALSGYTPDWGFSYQFVIPSDIMRVVSVGPNKELFWEHEQDMWVVESGYILADQADIYCRGIRRVNDEGIYSALFAHALAAKLGTLMALTLTQSHTIMEKMAGMYTSMINEAQTRDGLQGRSRRIRNRSMQKARAGRNRNASGW